MSIFVSSYFIEQKHLIPNCIASKLHTYTSVSATADRYQPSTMAKMKMSSLSFAMPIKKI